MTVTAPPRPPRPSDPVTHGEFDALVEALIEEARQRTRRRRRRNAAAVALVALVGVALFAALGLSAQSQTPSPALAASSSLSAATGKSKIAFIREPPRSGYCGTVWVMNADGSGQRRLTSGGVPGCGQEWGHAWSPDGRIAIVSNPLFPPPPGTPYTNDSKIYVMNADGSGQRRLTSDTGFEGNPAWSPDGRRIAFASGRDGSSGIYVINADGTEQRLLMPAAVTYPAQLAWSPNGEKIAFTIELPNAPIAQTRNLEIYVVNADGSGQRRLTRSTVRDNDPVWSPDGRRIAFESNWQLWVMNADGSGKRRLTRKGAHNFNPAWSPEGKRIAFERGRREREPSSGAAGSWGFGLYVMNADGSGEQRLTQGGSQPYWSPDGRKIAFVSNRDGNSDIHVMNPDGSGRRNLTRAAGRRDSGPLWSPALK
jgi:Tol biopolymer transport system component